ncbi:MAG: 16S rRNA (cytosine(967)-C(5))-methyltransferase RsmB [Oscillospiraceae bacterium]|jgi:16S rRNA (cytosine967-C5)-methyltransferase|nr:16S rRNA (cytosine(967)-C(5))-methyltransferase RsmB [Oscillospiraceae bacterium]
MSDATPARAGALRVLAARRHGGWPDRALKEELRRGQFSARDAALCTRLSYGVLQNEKLLDFYLAARSRLPLTRLEAGILDILRLGAYQLVFLDKVPDYAGVSACVDMARALSGDRAAGYVNAVLRALLREPLPQPGGTDVERLSVLYSRPAWQVALYLDRLGPDECEALLRADNGAPPVWVQANPLCGRVEELTERLAAEGVASAPHPFVPGCLALSHTGDIEALETYRAGWFLVADPAARLAVSAARPRPGETVIDGCAAPGGKSFLAALEMQNRGRVLACDIHRHKKTLLEKGAARLGLSAVAPCIKDAGVFDPSWEGSADLVIADLPCSGLGVVRKKPDIRDRDAGDVAGLPAVQRRLLYNLARYVRPGGRLLYVTCTLRTEENEAVADDFLRDHPAFAPEPFALPPPVGGTKGRVTLWPHRAETDGFFIALFGRTGGEDREKI